MQEEIKAKEEEAERIEAQITSGNLTETGVESKKEELASLTDQIRGLKEVYDKFSESRTRFMVLAKKALRLPSENFEQLADKGYTIISGEKIELSSLSSSYEEAEKALTTEENKDVFSNINNEEIKKEIERSINEAEYFDETINEKKSAKDYIIETGDVDETVSDLADFVKRNIDDKKEGELRKAGNAIFDLAIKKAKTNKSDANDIKKKKVEKESPIISYDGQEYEGKWVGDETFKPVSPINFDKDTSIEEFVESLKEKNTKLKARGEELSSQLSDVKAEQEKATSEQEQAKKDRDAAVQRATEAKKQLELMNTYKPKMDQLIKANAEQEKINRDKEAELQKETDNLVVINSGTAAIKTETAAYDEETRKTLEELKRLRAEFAGTKYPGDDDGQYGGVGGRRK